MAVRYEAPAVPRASVETMLSFVWDAEAFVSTDAMEATGLTRSTTIDALDELIELGLLQELPNARVGGQYSKGRPSRRFELRDDAAFVIGMDAGRSHITTTVADLRGREIAQQQITLDIERDSAEERRELIRGAVESAIVAAGGDRDRLLAVCIGVPAPVDSAGRSPKHRDQFWQRMNPDLHELLDGVVPIVRIENDASLAAVAEGSIGAAHGVRDYVALLAGDRFGAGVVIDGRLLRGAHGGVGEMVAFDHVFGDGAAEGLGFKLTAWAKQPEAAGGAPAGHPIRSLPAALLTSRVVLDAARDGDAWAIRLVERAGQVLARIAAVFGSLYDPQQIIVSGAVADGLDDVIEVARRELPEGLDLPAPELIASPLGGSAVAAGALAAALESGRAGILRLRLGTE